MDLPSLADLAPWLAPQSQSGLVDYAFYKLINNYFTEEINAFGFALMKRMMSWVASVAFTLATLYFLIMGYRVASGQSREPMMGLVVSGMKVALILGVATTMSFGNLNLYRLLTTGLDQEIHETVSGNRGQTAADAVDQNLAYMQVAMNAIDAVRIVDGDDETREQKSRALLMAGFGTASVPMTVGALMLMYKFGIAFFVGLAPLFILCLMFDQTRDLFRKWLMSGIATFFSMAALSMMSAMALKLTGKVAVAFWVSKAIGGIRGLEAEGMSSLAIQQGGLGLILTVALITVPPMVGMFFHGALGNFMQFSAFGGQGGAGVAHTGSAGPTEPARGIPHNRDTGAPQMERMQGSSYDPSVRVAPSGNLLSQNEIKKK